MSELSAVQLKEFCCIKFQRVGQDGVDWIHLSQGRDLQQSFVNVVTYIEFSGSLIAVGSCMIYLYSYVLA
jgi:hypothetical protein